MTSLTNCEAKNPLLRQWCVEDTIATVSITKVHCGTEDAAERNIFTEDARLSSEKGWAGVQINIKQPGWAGYKKGKKKMEDKVKEI